MSLNLNYNMIVLARESRGKSQINLANDLKIPQTLLSRIEHGIKTEVSEDILTRLSEILQYPKSFFYQPGNIVPISSEFQYRKGSSLKATDKKRIEADANTTKYQINRLLLNDKILDIWK